MSVEEVATIVREYTNQPSYPRPRQWFAHDTVVKDGDEGMRLRMRLIKDMEALRKELTERVAINGAAAAATVQVKMSEAFPDTYSIAIAFVGEQ
jgi:hypothetical protein